MDRRILGVLSRDGRITWLRLADEVGLSPSATTDRVRRLERSGVLVGYRAVIPPEQLGRPLEARIAATLRPDANRRQFITALVGEPAVIDAAHLTGPHDYELTVRCTDADELDALLIRLKDQHHVERTDTRIVLAHPVRRDLDPEHR